ncbi:MAG: RidA family protein [Alphaproteobacteria bacterium]
MTATSQTEDRLAAIGLSLPPREGPAYDYDPFKRDGDTVYLAGTLGKEDGAVRNLGKVGAEISEEEAGRQMQICALQALNWLREAADGDLDRVGGVLQLKCYVAFTPDFDGISRVADHASKVFMAAFGDDGRHPRSVLGMMRQPQNAPVMIDLVAGIRT